MLQWRKNSILRILTKLIVSMSSKKWVKKNENMEKKEIFIYILFILYILYIKLHQMDKKISKKLFNWKYRKNRFSNLNLKKSHFKWPRQRWRNIDMRRFVRICRWKYRLIRYISNLFNSDAYNLDIQK